MTNHVSRGVTALQAFVGAWMMEGSIDGRPLARARMVFDWIEGGAYLRERGQAETALPDTPPEWVANSPFPTTAIVGLDEATGEYSFLHSDARGVHRVYRMTLAAGTWTLRGSTENGYHQRFTGLFGPDLTRITAKWESSRDGETWHHDFDETYTKVVT